MFVISITLRAGCPAFRSRLIRRIAEVGRAALQCGSEEALYAFFLEVGSLRVEGAFETRVCSARSATELPNRTSGRIARTLSVRATGEVSLAGSIFLSALPVACACSFPFSIPPSVFCCENGSMSRLEVCDQSRKASARSTSFLTVLTPRTRCAVYDPVPSRYKSYR